MRYLKVKEKENLLRDKTTNAIVNTDMNQYKLYEDEYKRKMSDLQKVKNLEKDVSEIKKDLTEIKNLLRNLANES